MAEPVTICALLWAVDGQVSEMSDFEDQVLSLVPEHGGKVVNRLRNLDQDEGPTEVHVIEFPSESALDYYLNDDRRQALAADRDRYVARTQVFRARSET